MIEFKDDLYISEDLEIVDRAIKKIELDIEYKIIRFKKQSTFAVEHKVNTEEDVYWQSWLGFCGMHGEALIKEFEPPITVTYVFQVLDDEPDWFICTRVEFEVYYAAFRRSIDRAVRKTSRDTMGALDKIVEAGVDRSIQKALSHGSTLEQVQKERKELELRIAELDKAEAKAVEKEQKKPIKQQRSLNGYVYLLRAIHDDKLFKIGRAKDPNDRLKTFNVKLPFPIEYDCLVQTDDMYALESNLHAKFASKRLDGEWFRLEQEDVEYIRSLVKE